MWQKEKGRENVLDAAVTVRKEKDVRKSAPNPLVNALILC